MAFVAGAIAISGAATAYSGAKQASATEKASKAAQRQNEASMAEGQRAQKRADARTPNTAALLAMNANQTGKTASTFLTSPSGVTGGVPLSGNTLLGM